MHPAKVIFKANEGDNSAKKLNLMGTQFIMPAQVDPEVLKELPMDIRSQLMMAQNKTKYDLKPDSTSTSRVQSPAFISSRSQTPDVKMENHAIPPPSQLDLEVFEALPDDIKAEVLASYPSNSRTTSREQSLLPQSPRKVKTIPANKQTTPTKKRTGLLFRGRNNQGNGSSTLTQSNFVASKRNPAESSKAAFESADTEEEELDQEFLAAFEYADTEEEEPDQEFLAALPPDVRKEILDEHRRKRLAQCGNLGVEASKRRPTAFSSTVDIGQLRLRLPPRPPKPTFTMQNLTSLPELRETINSWHGEFADDGPHADDVGAMERYLRRVVLEERDAGKAVAVCKWMDWVVEESQERGRLKWIKAVSGMKETVQGAVKERGLGRVDI